MELQGLLHLIISYLFAKYELYPVFVWHGQNSVNIKFIHHKQSQERKKKFRKQKPKKEKRKGEQAKEIKKETVGGKLLS